VSEPTDAEPNPEKTLIPAEYETELQIVFHALGQMRDADQNQPAHWQVSGTQNIGILVSDTLMFQRAKPLPSDANLGNFYGLALPLILHGLPVEPVQIESTYRGQDAAKFLKQYKVLLLTYEGQKPPSVKFHDAIVAWVKAGGALVVMDDDHDPYNHAQDWWNENGTTQLIPRELLFRSLGIDPQVEGSHRVGKGIVIFKKIAPSALAADANGSDVVLAATREVARQIHLPWHESTALVLRRGPFVVASGFDKPEGTPEHAVTRVANSAVKALNGADAGNGNGTALPEHNAPAGTLIPGRFIDLFDAHLRVVENPKVGEGERRLLLDPAFFPTARAHVVAASAKVVDEEATSKTLQFSVTGIDGRDEHDLTAVRVLLPREAKGVEVDGNAVAFAKPEAGTVLIEFPAHAALQRVFVTF
jgi:hypothetical protein